MLEKSIRFKTDKIKSIDKENAQILHCYDWTRTTLNVQPTTKVLRARAHPLKPVVTIGNAGLHAGVHEEIETALVAHELIKIAINVGDRELRKQLTKQICEHSQAKLVQAIGKRIVIYRERPLDSEPDA